MLGTNKPGARGSRGKLFVQLAGGCGWSLVDAGRHHPYCTQSSNMFSGDPLAVDHFGLLSEPVKDGGRRLEERNIQISGGRANDVVEGIGHISTVR